MSGRRAHPRFAVTNPWDGGIHVLRDVVIDRTDRNELLAVSQAPGVVGEEMSLELFGAGASLALRVRVVESRPLIVDGAVRHRLRLELVAAGEDNEVSATALIQTLPGNAAAEAN